MTRTIKENNEDWSISFTTLFVVLRKEYKIILFVTLFFSVIGFFYISVIPDEYTAVGKIMPEVAYKAPNGMGGLNEVLKKYNGNVDLYNTEITNPELYAEILTTSNFYDYILAKEIKTRNKKMSFKSYYDFKLKNEKSFFKKEEKDFKANDKIKYQTIIQDIQKRIGVTITKKNNLVFVTVKMGDPVVAADVANFTINYLIEYITQYRTEKARQELHFIENLQNDLSKDSLKSESLKNEIQNNLAAATIQMKIRIQENTPTIEDRKSVV